MIKKNAIQLLLTVLAVSLFVAGCGESGPATVPAKGTLTIDGQPADNVSITLIPVSVGAAGQEAAGQVKGGSFELFTGNKGIAGAIPGKYKVVLSAIGGGDGAPSYMQPGSGARGAGGTATPQQKLPFPEKYRSPDTSDKEVEITPGANELKIEITS